jgi:hypothetical protein
MGTDYRKVGDDTADTHVTSHASKTQERREQLTHRLLVTAAALVALLFIAGLLVWLLTGENTDAKNSDRGTVRASHGPTAVEDGVPGGYTQDEQGASTAAVNTIQAIAQAGQGRIDMNAVRASMISPEPGTTLTEALDSESNRDEDEDVLSLLPGAVTVTSFTPEAAEVSVWTIGIGQSEINNTGKVAVSTTYSTTDLSLVWQDGDWKAQDWTFRQGPRPEDASYPAAESTLGDELTSGYYTFYID